MDITELDALDAALTELPAEDITRGSERLLAAVHGTDDAS